MTTYTSLNDGETPQIVVHPTHKISEVNDNIYGGFAEHVGKSPAIAHASDNQRHEMSIQDIGGLFANFW